MTEITKKGYFKQAKVLQTIAFSKLNRRKHTFILLISHHFENEPNPR